jgi:hypothetical protein
MAEPTFQNAQFDALRNAIYHAARGRCLERWNRYCNFFIIFLGAAAVSKFALDFKFGDAWIQIAIVVVATMQLVFDYGGRAAVHLFLQKRYYDLLAEIEVARDSDSEAAKRKWSAKLLTIAGDEPIPMRALDAIAYNTALDSWTSDPKILHAHRLYVPLRYRLLKNVVAFQGTQFVPKTQRKRVSTRLREWWGNGKKES